MEILEILFQYEKGDMKNAREKKRANSAQKCKRGEKEERKNTL